MAEKNSFILRNEYLDIFADLSDSQAGVLIKAVYKYAAAKEMPEGLKDVEVKMAFKFIKKDIDYDTTKYNELCESRRNAVAKRWETNKSIQKHTKDTNVYKCIQEHTKNTNVDFVIHSDSDSVCDSDNELVDKSTNNITPLPPLKRGVECFSFVANEYKATFDKWLTYKKERKQSYKGAISARQCYNQLLELSGNNAAIAEKIVNQSIANNWSGLFPLKEEKGALNNGAVDYNRNADTSKYANLGRKIN